MQRTPNVPFCRVTLGWLPCAPMPVGEKRGLVGKLLDAAGRPIVCTPNLLGCLLGGVLACSKCQGLISAQHDISGPRSLALTWMRIPDAPICLHTVPSSVLLQACSYSMEYAGVHQQKVWRGSDKAGMRFWSWLL